jgi:hypothetical protein
MTGVRAAFTELDDSITGSVKFGYGSRGGIRGRGTVVFRCLNDEHRALTDVYYIPQLRSSIVSLGQLNEHGCKVQIENGVLRIHDQERRLLARVRRTANRLYLLDLRLISRCAWQRSARRSRGCGTPGLATSASTRWGD